MVVFLIPLGEHGFHGRCIHLVAFGGNNLTIQQNTELECLGKQLLGLRENLDQCLTVDLHHHYSPAALINLLRAHIAQDGFLGLWALIQQESGFLDLHQLAGPFSIRLPLWDGLERAVGIGRKAPQIAHRKVQSRIVDVQALGQGIGIHEVTNGVVQTVYRCGNGLGYAAPGFQRNIGVV